MRRAAAVAAAAAALTLPAGAQATNVAFEGESMTWNGNGQQLADPTASGGQAFQNWNTGEGYKDVTLTGSVAALFALVKGDQCPREPDGSPMTDPVKIEIKVDGQPVHQGDVPNTTYAEVGGPVSIGAGTHRVSIHMTNDLRLGQDCDRNLWVDKVTLYGEPMAPDSFRNQPLSPTEPLDPQSAAWVAELQRQVAVWGPWVGTTEYSVPIYVVGAQQSPKFDFKVVSNWYGPGYDDPPNDQEFKGVPVPTPLPQGPVISDGTDRDLTVWQPATDRYWEFLETQWDAVQGYRTGKGGRIDGVSTSPGYQVDPPGWRYALTATAITPLGTTLRIPELQRGVINHAVSVGIPDPKFIHCWPAQSNDYGPSIRDYRANVEGFGDRQYNEMIPEGTRFRLRPDLDIDALHLPRFTETLAKAIQKYGMVVQDYGGAVGFQAEDWRTHWKSDPYEGENGIFEGHPRGANPPQPAYHDGFFVPHDAVKEGLFYRFPWADLQVVAVPPGKPPCSETDFTPMPGH